MIPWLTRSHCSGSLHNTAITTLLRALFMTDQLEISGNSKRISHYCQVRVLIQETMTSEIIPRNDCRLLVLYGYLIVHCLHIRGCYLPG